VLDVPEEKGKDYELIEAEKGQGQGQQYVKPRQYPHNPP
jgi:hypothetical protein